MIKFRYYQDKGYQHFEVDGHADYNVIGFDAVCGMVSMLAQSALYGCQKYAEANCVVVRNGLLKFKCSKDNAIAVAIMDSCAEGIKQVQAQFPYCFDTSTNELDIPA